MHELPKPWGKNFDPEYQRLVTPSCPNCGNGLGDMIVDHRGQPVESLLSLVVGYTTSQAVSKQFKFGAAIFECPKCLNFCWFHLEEPWARAVAEFAPKSPYFKRLRYSLKGEELLDALGDMNVFDKSLFTQTFGQ